jgi:hypothetical protein
MLSKIRREAAYWRTLLRKIAADLDNAARVERDPARQRWFESRAARVRQRLNRGVPDDWVEGS